MLVKAIAATLAATLGTLMLFLAATTAVIGSTIGPFTGPTISAGPAPDTLGPLCPAAWRGNAAGFRSDQLTNAATIIAVGAQLGVPAQGWLVALAAALTESRLRNLPYGDRDSLGLFQQRPSQGWGAPAQILNPRYSATQFYRHLLAQPGWRTMTVNDAAQAVQRSATPTAYGPHEPAARALLHTLTNVNQPDTRHTSPTHTCSASTPLPCTPRTTTTPPGRAATTTRTPSPPTCTSGAP